MYDGGSVNEMIKQSLSDMRLLYLSVTIVYFSGASEEPTPGK